MDPQNEPTPGTPPQPETPPTAPQAPQPAPETQPEPPETPVTPVDSSQPGTATATPSGDWPGAFGSFKHAVAATKVNLWTILSFDLIAILISSVGKDNAGLKFVGFLISIWAQLALVSLYLASARKQEQKFTDAAKVGLQRYVDGFIASILTALLVGLSFLALIVPFFFVLPRLQLVMYFLVDRKLGPIDAIKASWHESKGFSLKIWGMIGVSVLFGILCLLLVGIYLLFMYQTVFALFYLYMSGKKAAAPSEPAVEPTASPA